MGWDNPPVPWRELERRLSWDMTRQDGSEPAGVVQGRFGPQPDQDDGPPWAELHCHSSYSFLDGASSPAELVAEAARQGVQALALTDHDGMYGVAQFAQAAAQQAEQTGISLGTIFGAELSVGPGGRPYRPSEPGLRPAVVLGRRAGPAGRPPGTAPVRSAPGAVVLRRAPAQPGLRPGSQRPVCRARYPPRAAQRSGGFRGVAPPGQHSAAGGSRGVAPPGRHRGSGGGTSAGAGPGCGGVPAAVHGDQRGPAGGGREGAAGL